MAPALPSEDLSRFERWRANGMAGSMTYLTDHRGDLRSNPKQLLASAQTIVCVGKLYNTRNPSRADPAVTSRAGISRYALGSDYHEVVRRGLEKLVELIRAVYGEPFEHRICVDTAPLLERSYARAAGLGWIGRNTCLINQQHGSWFFLGEILLSLELTPDSPPPDRCGTCRRCIDACPTDALLPQPDGTAVLDARQCISYLTIENRGDIPPALAAKSGNHIFGCDICQDVCPWNGRAPVTTDAAFEPLRSNQFLEHLAELSEADFRTHFRSSPIWRAKYSGFLRNVATAMGNAGHSEFLEPLQRLATHPEPLVANAARQALDRLSVETPGAGDDGQ